MKPLQNIFSFILALFAFILLSGTICLVPCGCIMSLKPSLWCFTKTLTIFAVACYTALPLILYFLINPLFAYAFSRTSCARALARILMLLHAAVAVVTVCLLFTVHTRYSGYHYTLAVILSVWCLYTHYNYILKHLTVAGIAKEKENAPQKAKPAASKTDTPPPTYTPKKPGQTILCKEIPDGRIFFHTIDEKKRIPNIEDLLNRYARSLTGDHMKKLAQAASSAPKKHLPAYYSAAAYYYFYIEHNPYSAYLCCVSTLSLLSCMSKYDLFMPEYQWIAREPDLSSMLFDGDLGINKHPKQFYSLDMLSGRKTDFLSAPILSNKPH